MTLNLARKFVDYGLVDIESTNQDILVELKYTSKDNFIHKDVYGELTNAFFVPEVAERLASVQQKLSLEHPGWHLLVYDAARPLSIQRLMFDTVRGTDMEKYVANPDTGGFHNYGVAVDLTIAGSGNLPLDMGSAFDCFEDVANVGFEQELVDNGLISREAMENRFYLQSLMISEGFTQNPDEWWHFQLGTLEEVSARYPVLDF